MFQNCNIITHSSRDYERSFIGPLHVVSYDIDTSALPHMRKRKVKLDKSIQNGYSDTIVSDGSAKTSSKKHRPKSAGGRSCAKKSGKCKRRSKSLGDSYEQKQTEEKGTLTKSQSHHSLHSSQNHKHKHQPKKKPHNSNSGSNRVKPKNQSNSGIHQVTTHSYPPEHNQKTHSNPPEHYQKTHIAYQNQANALHNRYEETLSYNHTAVYQNLPSHHRNVFHAIPYQTYARPLHELPPRFNPTPQETRFIAMNKKKKNFNNPVNSGNHQYVCKKYQDQNKFRTNNCNVEPRVRQKSGDNVSQNNNFYRAENPRNKPTKAKLNDFISNNKPPKQKKKNRKSNNVVRN